MTKRAKRIPANPALQQYGMGGPFEYYEDLQLRCHRCLVIFIFSAEEQQHWYEVLQFTVDSWPTACAECRHFYRRLKGAHQFLAQLKNGQISTNAASLGEMAVLYAHLGRTNKATSAMRQALKLMSNREQRGLLEQNVERASAAPELLERAVPNFRTLSDRMLLLHVGVVVGNAYQQHAIQPAPSARAAIERVHQTVLGIPGTLFIFKRRLIEIIDEACQYLQSRGVVELGDLINNYYIQESLLTLMYQRLGNLRSREGGILGANEERLIDAFHTIVKNHGFNSHSSQQVLDTNYPVEVTNWGGYLLPHCTLNGD